MRRIALILLFGSALVAGCGGGSSSSNGTTSAATQSNPASSTTQAAASTTVEPPQVRSSHVTFGSLSDVPRSKGGDNSIQDFGSEAGAVDRIAAARVVTAYLQAISVGDSKTACALVASATIQRLQQAGASAQGGSGTCASLIGRLTATLPAGLKQQVRTVRVLSVRVDGNRGFIIFDGIGNRASNMPLAAESGSWKVAAIGPIPLQY